MVVSCETAGFSIRQEWPRAICIPHNRLVQRGVGLPCCLFNIESCIQHSKTAQCSQRPSNCARFWSPTRMWSPFGSRSRHSSADDAAKLLYQSVAQGEVLHRKQQQGLTLAPAEIADFERERDSLLGNDVARGFLEAQQRMHEVRDCVTRYMQNNGTGPRPRPRRFSVVRPGLQLPLESSTRGIRGQQVKFWSLLFQASPPSVEDSIIARRGGRVPRCPPTVPLDCMFHRSEARLARTAPDMPSARRPGWSR